MEMGIGITKDVALGHEHGFSWLRLGRICTCMTVHVGSMIGIYLLYVIVV